MSGLERRVSRLENKVGDPDKWGFLVVHSKSENEADRDVAEAVDGYSTAHGCPPAVVVRLVRAEGRRTSEMGGEARR